MTHVTDLYEPGDDREPGEPEQAPPLDLDGLQKLYDLAEEPGGLPAWGRVVYLEVPALIAELREARGRIAEFEALPTRMEIVAATDHPDKAGLIVPFGSYVKADEYADATPGCQVFYRFHSLHPWQEIDPKAPF